MRKKEIQLKSVSQLDAFSVPFNNRRGGWRAKIRRCQKAKPAGRPNNSRTTGDLVSIVYNERAACRPKSLGGQRWQRQLETGPDRTKTRFLLFAATPTVDSQILFEEYINRSLEGGFFFFRFTLIFIVKGDKCRRVVSHRVLGKNVFCIFSRLENIVRDFYISENIVSLSVKNILLVHFTN